MAPQTYELSFALTIIIIFISIILFILGINIFIALVRFVVSKLMKLFRSDDKGKGTNNLNGTSGGNLTEKTQDNKTDDIHTNSEAEKSESTLSIEKQKSSSVAKKNKTSDSISKRKSRSKN